MLKMTFCYPIFTYRWLRYLGPSGRNNIKQHLPFDLQTAHELLRPRYLIQDAQMQRYEVSKFSHVNVLKTLAHLSLMQGDFLQSKVDPACSENTVIV